MNPEFNLVSDQWIPISGRGLVSLREIFGTSGTCQLGGNPIQKIAVFKLLLSIAQAASTPDNEDGWSELGADGLASACLSYLENWRDSFFFYGEAPFLQMPSVEKAISVRTEQRVSKAKTVSAKKVEIEKGMPRMVELGFYPDMPADNNTFLSHTLMGRELDDAERALFLIMLMNFAFGGKRVESSLVSLSGSKLGAQYSAAAAPSLGGYVGLLHSFVITDSIVEGLWMNLLTLDDLKRLGRWKNGLGRPVWESMPSSEDDEVAARYKETYQSTLIALSRFILFKERGVFYLDGLQYPKVSDGWYEPSLLLDYSGKEVKARYVDPEKRPWRELQSLLSFMEGTGEKGFECFLVEKGVRRARFVGRPFGVWSGGIKVTANSGDQSVKQSDDFVESLVWLDSSVLGEVWFSQLKKEMEELGRLNKLLFLRVDSFYRDLGVKERSIAGQATNQFWQLCERVFQKLVDSCQVTEKSAAERHQVRKVIAGYVFQSYDNFCPKETARQLDAWAKNRPRLGKYLAKED